MLLEKNSDLIINDILNGHFELVKEYPDNPNSKVIGAIYLPKHKLELKLYEGLRELSIHFFEKYPFDFSLYLSFFKQMNSIYSKTYNGFEPYLSIYVEKFILPIYFYQEEPNKSWSKWLKKPNLYLTKQDQDILKIFMYGIRCMAYTQSPNYEMKEYLGYVHALDMNLYQQLVSMSNAELEIEVITIENTYFKAVNNNVLASIEIQAFRHDEETYKEVLKYINQLFAEGFPQSHQLKFEVKEVDDQQTLSIVGLPDYGANRLFNSAAQYHNLHSDIETYLNHVKDGCGFYTNLHETSYVEVDSFAIFSLVIEDVKYMDRFIQFLNKIDDHCTLQNYIPSAFLERQGITNFSVKTYLRMCEELLKHENFLPYSDVSLKYFNDFNHMKILVEEVNIYVKEQHEISWSDIFLAIVGYGEAEDLMHEEFAMQKFKSHEIWNMYLMIKNLK